MGVSTVEVKEVNVVACRNCGLSNVGTRQTMSQTRRNGVDGNNLSEKAKETAKVQMTQHMTSVPFIGSS